MAAKKAAGKSGPFPFFGQGHAEYYEWFEMWIWFVKPVPVAKRKGLSSTSHGREGRA